MNFRSDVLIISFFTLAFVIFSLLGFHYLRFDTAGITNFNDLLILAFGFWIVVTIFIAFTLAPLHEIRKICLKSSRNLHEKKQLIIARTNDLKFIKREFKWLSKSNNFLSTRHEKEKAQLKSMLSAMDEGLVAFDREKRISFCNQTAYKLLNSKLIDCRGMLVENANGFLVLEKMVTKIISTHKSFEEEIRIQHQGSLESIIQCKGTLFEIENEMGIIVVLRDLTRLTRLENMRRDFVANVSHEIKTPLTAIKGYAETLLSGALEDPTVNKHYIERIDRNASRLMVLVQDILTLSKIQSDNYISSRSAVNWQEIIRSVISRYEYIIQEKSIQMILDFPKEVLFALGEPESMEQIADNLISNALRYSNSNGQIKIRSNQGLDENEVELTIEDEGIGIEESHLERIFERFYRVDQDRSIAGGGTGLGLSIVKHLVNGMQGKISVRSALGKGSRFSVVLEKSQNQHDHF